MQYKNGRTANNGDKVAWLAYGTVMIGVLYTESKGGVDTPKLASIASTDPSPTLSDCVRLDDFFKAVPGSIPVVEPTAPTPAAPARGSNRVTEITFSDGQTPNALSGTPTTTATI